MAAADQQVSLDQAVEQMGQVGPANLIQRINGVKFICDVSETLVSSYS